MEGTECKKREYESDARKDEEGMRKGRKATRECIGKSNRSSKDRDERKSTNKATY